MKRLLLIFLTVFSLSLVHAQKVNRVTLGMNGGPAVISFLIDDDVIVNVSLDGKVLDWGIESNITGRYGIVPGRLDKYMGMVEYYSADDNEASRGKVKYIGRTGFTYYSADENEVFKGKLKMVGTNLIDYYTTYDDVLMKGNIKNAGSTLLTYYGSFENEAYKGRLSSIGQTSISYYSSFDDVAIKGKLKSIDRFEFTYYNSFDKKEYRGIMKSGFQTQYINGINFIVKY